MLEEISGQSLQDQDWKSTKCSKKCQAQACRFRTGKVPNARRNVRPKLEGLQLENYQILEELSGQSFGFSHHQIFELLQPLSKQKCVSFWSADGFYSFHFNAWLHFLSKLLPPSADRSQFNGKDFEFSSPSQVCTYLSSPAAIWKVPPFPIFQHSLYRENSTFNHTWQVSVTEWLLNQERFVWVAKCSRFLKDLGQDLLSPRFWVEISSCLAVANSRSRVGMS